MKRQAIAIVGSVILGRILFVLAFGDTNIVTSDHVTYTNKLVNVFAISTNNEVTFDGKPIGRIEGTNYVAVPDVRALTKSYGDGFALGVRYGAIATRRNPDVAEWTALVDIAASIMKVEQQRQAAKK